MRGVLDHHIDKAEYDELLEFKDVRICGAAVTLILCHIFFDGLQDQILDKEGAFFICAPIIIDSKWFNIDLYKKKWTDLDRTNFDKLVKIVSIEESYFKELWRLKTDEEVNLSLGWSPLTRKDYKNYDFNGTIMGISTVFLSEKFITDSFDKETIKAEITKLMEEKGLKLYGLLTHYEDKHHKT